MNMVRTLALFLMTAGASALYAQGPAADWRTIETAHFRVHYPREYEEWSTRAASRLESIREAVSAEVGFAPPQKIDVLISNPYADPNGVAWPFLDTPRMLFYTEPPGPDEQLGAYGHWIDLLAVHETAHLVHMLRPTRNPLGRAFEKFVLPLNPITLRAPRWVLEGYATVVEGRLTGAGRPTSTIRALILRRWAENGRLPTYGQLDSDQRFLGMSMAYLMGSAYLEWLERRSGPDSLRNLWSRLTARHRRSFNEAFIGVFGESPERLYGQFVAELTASAVTIQKGSTFREGELFQETNRGTGDPAVSPDGKQLAIIIREREQPEKLVIWSTDPPTDEEKKFAERLKRILERDPEDVAPVRAKPLPRKAVHTLVMPDGGDIEMPRWTRDGKALIFSHRTRDGEGFLHWDLYRWDFSKLTRITHLADVREADPIDDHAAIAIRTRYGASELVTVDLRNGAITSRTQPSIDEVRATPRVSPDGTKIAHVAHQSGAWALLIDGQRITLPGDAASPAWLSNDELIVTVFTRGFAELHRVRLGGATTQITRSAGGAFDPAPASDGRVFFTSLNPDGYVVRVVDANGEAATAQFAQAFVVPGAAKGVSFSDAAVTSRAYGIGRQELAWFTATNVAPEQRSFELGVRLGDVVGRFDTILVAALGRDDLPSGGAVATAWRGWPVELHAHVYTAEEENSGGELRARWSRVFPLSRLTLEGGASDDLAFATAAFTTRQHFGTRRIEEAIRIDADDEHFRATAAAAYRRGSFSIRAQYQIDRGTNVTLGGLPSTILPRSKYAHRILDPALPVAILRGDDYDGWRIETTVPGLPFTAFYQRHELDATELSLAGAHVAFNTDPNPILKTPALDLILGAAYLFDQEDTQWWLGMRWRP